MKKGSRLDGILILTIARFVSLVLQFFLVPVYISILGDSGYAIVLFVLSYTNLVHIVDCEVPYGLLHLLSKTSRTDKVQFDKYFRNGLLLNIFGGLIGCLVLILSPLFFKSFAADIAGFPEVSRIFLFAGGIFFLGHVSNTYIAPLMAREQFKTLATYTAYLPIINILVTSGLVFWLRTPFAFMYAMLLDVLVQLGVRFFYILKFEPDLPLLPAYDCGICKEILVASFRNLVPAISNRIGANGDKLAVQLVLGNEAAVNYNLICRIPQLLQELVARITDVITPEMTHVAHNEKEQFTPIFLRNFSITSGVVVCSIFFVSAFGESLLHIWANRTIENFGVLSFMMAIYYGLESYHSIITKGFYAHNITHYLLPFTLWNSLITVLFSKMLAQKFGLLGIAGMNVLIDVTQIVPIHWYAAKHILPGTTSQAFLARSMRVIIPGILICLPIVLVTTLLKQSVLAWLFVASIPVLSVGLMCLFIRLNLVETTDNFTKLLRKIPGVKLILN